MKTKPTLLLLLALLAALKMSAAELGITISTEPPKAATYTVSIAAVPGHPITVTGAIPIVTQVSPGVFLITFAEPGLPVAISVPAAFPRLDLPPGYMQVGSRSVSIMMPATATASVSK